VPRELQDKKGKKKKGTLPFFDTLPSSMPKKRVGGRLMKLAKSDTILLWFGLVALILSGCGPSQQWVKPGATEADLRTAITLCDRENVRFGRDRITTMGPEDEVMVTRQKRYRRGAGEMIRERCLESRGWTLEYVE
jgi:hypothetical protein